MEVQNVTTTQKEDKKQGKGVNRFKTKCEEEISCLVNHKSEKSIKGDKSVHNLNRQITTSSKTALFSDEIHEKAYNTIHLRRI